MPDMTKNSALKLPPLQEDRLKNGIRIILAERHTIPVINLSVQFNAGTVSDQNGKEGTADYAFGLMNEGTKSLTSLEMADTKEMLGADIGFNNGRDTSSITLSALKKNLDPSVKLWADVVQNPGFRPEDFERDRGLILNQIEQSKVNARSIAMSLLAKKTYGEGHPYGLSSQGTEKSIKAMTRKDLTNFINGWIRPDNATIFVVGDTTMADIKPVLEKYFGKWRAPKVPKGKKNIPNVDNATRTRIYLVDKPGSPQATIVAGQIAPSNRDPRFFNVNAVNEILGGNFSARLNMNLREDKGWAYGAFSGVRSVAGPGLYILFAPVQIDKTAEAMQEVLKETTNLYNGTKPATEEEIALMRKNKVLTLPGRFESASALLGYIMDNEVRGRDYKYAETLPEKYQAITVDIIQKTAKDILKPDALTWVVVGDLSKIEQKIRDLKLGKVMIVDAEGKPVK